MTLLPRRAEWDALRVSFWIALALLFANAVVWPEFLDGPVSRLGDEEDGFAMDIHWVPTALVVWVIVAAVWRSHRQSRGVRLSSPYSRSAKPPAD